MAEINVPVADQDIDTSEPLGAVKTFAMLIVGMAVFFMATRLGQRLADKVENTTGVDVDEAVPQF